MHTGLKMIPRCHSFRKSRVSSVGGGLQHDHFFGNTGSQPNILLFYTAARTIKIILNIGQETDKAVIGVYINMKTSKKFKKKIQYVGSSELSCDTAKLLFSFKILR